MSVRPILVSGVALASAGAIVAALPAALPAQQSAVTVSASAPAKKTLTVDQLNLLALSDVTLQGIIDVFNEGYGEGVLPDDPYYPTDDPIFVAGLAGVAYYLGDEALLSVMETGLPLVSDAAQFTYDNVTSYFYEIGATAALHVALAEATGGPETPFAQILQFIFNRGGVEAVSAALMALPAPDPLSYIPRGVIEAFVDGWGGGIQPDDPYYPSEHEIFVDGFTGAAYYLSDQVLLSAAATGLPVLAPLAEFGYYDVTTYLFEVGGAAALHAALAEATGGPDTPFAQILQRIFNPGAGIEELAAPAGEGVGAKASRVTEADGGNGPEVLPKKSPAAVVDLSLDVAPAEGVVPDAGEVTEEADEQEGTEEAELKPVKKGPKLNVKKENPLAGLTDKVGDVKKDVDKAAKNLSDSWKKLTGGAETEDPGNAKSEADAAPAGDADGE